MLPSADAPPGPDLVTHGGTHCRFCEAPLELTMVDLGKSPLCESFLPADRLETMEPFYPLHVRVCTRCWLAQLPAFVPPDEIFHEYAYFSAYSDSWVEHARDYVDMITSRLALALGQPRRRARLERRLPAAALPAEGHPRARDRPGRERRAVRQRNAAFRRWSSSSASSSPSG